MTVARTAGRLVAAAAGLAIGVTTAHAQRTAPRPLENMKVLNGWTSDDVRAEMRHMADGLGVKCDYCHVQGNFASDEKRPKHAARRMLQLTQTLNKESFPDYVPRDGESKLGRVTCYTCHQGAQTPRLSAGPQVRR